MTGATVATYDAWVRSTITDGPMNVFYGSVPMVTISPGQTLLRSWWNISLKYISEEVVTYPPGNSMLRAGVVWAPASTLPDDVPRPITNADADWLYIETLNPRKVCLDRQANVAWYIEWGHDYDRSIKSMRKNRETAEWFTLFTSWEVTGQEGTGPFGIQGYSTSLDCLVRVPPLAAQGGEPTIASPPLPSLGVTISSQ